MRGMSTRTAGAFNLSAGSPRCPKWWGHWAEQQSSAIQQNSRCNAAGGFPFLQSCSILLEEQPEEDPGRSALTSTARDQVGYKTERRARAEPPSRVRKGQAQ